MESKHGWQGLIDFKGSGGLTEMSLQKALCMICELPTADGAISAVRVDKDKLQTWFLNVCGHEMAEEVDDDDLICYFCLWHAEFQLKFDELADEALVWWNLGLELDDAARELRRNYFEGKLEQCWVQLEKIEIPQSADGEEGQIVEAKIRLRRWNCIYCGKRYKASCTMYKHVKKMHKQALRYLKMCQWLCGKNVDVLNDDELGNTVIHFAAKNNKFGKSLVPFFVSKGVNVNLKNNNSHSAFCLALYTENIAAAEELLKAGADMDIKLENGDNNALHFCTLHWQSEQHTEEIRTREKTDQNSDIRKRKPRHFLSISPDESHTAGSSHQWAMNSSHAEQALMLAVANDNLKKQMKELGTQLKEDQAFVEQTNKLISVYEVVHKQDKAIIEQQNVIIAARDEKIAALGRQEVKKPNCKPSRKGSEKRLLRTLVKLAEKLKANDLLTIYYTKKLEEWTALLNDGNNDTYDVDGLEERSEEKTNCEAPAENLVTAVVMLEETAVPSDAPPSPASEKTAEETEPGATEEAVSILEENIIEFEPLNELTAAADPTAEENLIPKDVDGEATVMNGTPVSVADAQSAEFGGNWNEAVDIFDEVLGMPYDTPETLSAADNDEVDMMEVEIAEAQSKPVQAGGSSTDCAHQDAAMQQEAEEPNPSTTGKSNDAFEDGEDDWMELSDDDSVCDVSLMIDEEAAATEGEDHELSVPQEAPEKETAETADSQEVVPMVESQAEYETESQGELAPPADADKVAQDLLQVKNDVVPAKIVEDQVSHLISTDLDLASLWDTHEEIETQSLALEVPAERATDAPSTWQSSNAEEAAHVQNPEGDEEPEMVLPKKVLKRKSGALKQNGCPKKAKKSWKYSPGKTDTPQLSSNCSRMKIEYEAPDAMARPRLKKTLGRNKRLLDYPEFEVQRRKKNKQRSQREKIKRRMEMLVGSQLCGFTVTNLDE
ncbi:Hypothetical predicted protein [Cloeon dipterum]|uniref:C2H2-type domain-containing protein n=1 Tax=Cloeon dipterum TaxID=197152 RepID=A0A8S1DKJ2_9INSE|nr:Hypothetical predicted protein [Cloeon dipterum]